MGGIRYFQAEGISDNLNSMKIPIAQPSGRCLAGLGFNAFELLQDFLQLIDRLLQPLSQGLQDLGHQAGRRRRRRFLFDLDRRRHRRQLSHQGLQGVIQGAVHGDLAAVGQYDAPELGEVKRRGF